MLKRAGYWVAEWAVLFLFWEVFVDKLEGHEIAAGLAAAALSAAGTEMVRGVEHPRFYPQAAMLAQAWRVPGMVLKGCWVLALRLARRAWGDCSAGLFRTIRFHGGGSEPKDVGRRALAVVFSTLPPNSLVIGIDRRRNFLMLHQVRSTGVPALLRKLGARP